MQRASASAAGAAAAARWQRAAAWGAAAVLVAAGWALLPSLSVVPQAPAGQGQPAPPARAPAPPPPPEPPPPSAGAPAPQAEPRRGSGSRLIVTFLLNAIYKTYKKHGADPCATLASAAAQGLQVDVHGWGLPAHNVTRERIVLIERYLHHYADDDVVLFADAGDTLFYLGAEAILERFWRLHRPGKVLFSAEQFCLGALGEGLWPPRLGLGPYHCLNTGGFVGRAGDLKRLYALLLRAFEARRGLALYLEDQNFLYTQWAAWGLGRHIELDNGTEIWQTMYQDRGFGWGGKKTLALPGDKRWRYCVYDLFEQGAPDPPPPPPGRLRMPLRNRRTGGRPALVHFNGPAKLCWPNYLGVLPQLPAVPRGARLRLGRATRRGEALVETPLAKLCPRAAPP